MRIAVDASILELPCPTGVERAAFELVSALPATLGPRDELIVLARGVPALRLPESPRVRVVGLGGREPLAVWRETRLAAALPSQAADVLWSPVAALPYRAEIPRVATVHELPWRVRAGMEGRLREHVHRVRVRLAAQCARLVVVPSEFTAAQLRDEVPDAAGRVRVVPHGVAPRFLAPVDAAAAARLRRHHAVPDAPYLLHVGGTRPRKAVPLLLRAYARYRLQGGTRALVLAGPGDAPERPPAGVVHLGWVADDLLLALYDGAAALVVASESEGFGLPCLEAGARGVPVVARSTGALPEVLGDAGLLVDGADEELAAALVRLDRERGLAERLVDRGRARAAARTIEAAARRLRAVLDEAVT